MKEWTGRAAAELERRGTRNADLALARDVDGIVWIRTVSAPSLPLGRRLLFGSLHYATEIIVVICILLILLIGTPVYFWMKRRRFRPGHV